MTRFIMLPTTLKRKQERKRTQERAARRRYEATHPRRKTEYRDRRRKARPFIMWDGEGPQDTGYSLFGNSEGYEICHPYLETIECLELILDCARENPGAIHIAFGFNYDVSMILRQLPWKHFRALHNFTGTVWKDYEIEHIPHKWFKVSKDGVTCKIYDIRSFFAGGYLNAIEAFEIGEEWERDRIAKGKAGREIFQWSQIQEIREYWLIELRLGPLLGERMRDVFSDAGYVPSSWHGPGALARMALKRHKVYDAMAQCPYDVRVAAQYAFAGGRFELFQAGQTQKRVYNADIHSAYPYFATFVPNLNRGNWRRTRNYEHGKFGVYHIRYDAKPDNSRPFPLFCRRNNGCVVWPNRVVGWYWNPEAELVANDSDATFLEGWVFDEDDETDRPFAWLAEYYNRRRRLKNNGSAAEYTFKLIINSVYGQLAQRAGWDRKRRTPPKSHQLEWAGFITSGCRAAVFKVAQRCGNQLVSIDTDGVASLEPFDGIDVGGSLGEWEVTDYDDGIFWQSGIYCLKIDGEWQKARSRGIRKGSYQAEDLLECLRTGQPLRLTRRVFYTYGLADMGQRHLLNTWADEPHAYEMGGGKRVHSELACRTSCAPPLHRLWQWSPTYGAYADDVTVSRKHYLPWLDADTDDDSRKIMDDFSMYDADHLDEQDLWVLDCA